MHTRHGRGRSRQDWHCSLDPAGPAAPAPFWTSWAPCSRSITDGHASPCRRRWHSPSAWPSRTGTWARRSHASGRYRHRHVHRDSARHLGECSA